MHHSDDIILVINLLTACHISLTQVYLCGWTIGVLVRVRVMMGSCVAPTEGCVGLSRSLGAMLIWLQFRRICPFGVSTMYDRGVAEWLTVRPGMEFPPVVIHTSESSGISGSGRVRCRQSKSCFCFLFLSISFSRNTVRYPHCSVREAVVVGTSVRSFRPIRSSAGERLHHGKGIAL